MLTPKNSKLFDRLKDPSQFGTMITRPDEIKLRRATIGYPYVLLVGDMTTKTFMDRQIRFDMAIIDFKTKRKHMDGVKTAIEDACQKCRPKVCPKCDRELETNGDPSVQAQYRFRIANSSIISVNNPPGGISDDLINAIRWHSDSRDHTTFLVVDGEEDLAVLPAIVLLPLGSLIFYGQPPSLGFGSGIVRCEVTGSLRSEVYKILGQMKYEEG